MAGTQSFAYDSQNRLIRAEYPTYAESFYYDKAGNRSRYTASLISPSSLPDPSISTEDMPMNPHMASLGREEINPSVQTGSIDIGRDININTNIDTNIDIDIEYQYGP